MALTDREVLAVIKRRSLEPEPGETPDDVSRAYDRTIEILRDAIPARTGLYAAAGDGTAMDPDEYLESVDAGNGDTAIQWLHGSCGVFALALNRMFGYDIRYMADAEDLADARGPLDALVHAYCERDLEFIDVRGMTDDMRECFGPFEDFFTEPVVVGISPEELTAGILENVPAADLERDVALAMAFIGDRKKAYTIS